MASPNKNHVYRATIGGRASLLISNAKRRCRDKNIEFHLTRQWVEEHLARNTCEITGMLFDFGPPIGNVSRMINAPSLDRIDKNKHYTEDNTRVILWAVNCALAEYGTEVMLPILKATVKGIENAQQKSTTPVSEGIDSQSEHDTKRRAVLAARLGEDRNHPDNHSRTIPGEDADHRAQESSGDSMGSGSAQVGTFVTSYDIQNNGLPCAEVILAEYRGRRIPDKS